MPRQSLTELFVASGFGGLFVRMARGRGHGAGWLRFQGYTKLIVLRQGGTKGGKAAKPAA